MLKVALVSFDPSLSPLEKNISTILEYIKSSSELGASLVIFPEMTLTGFEFPIGVLPIETYNKITDYIVQWAKKYSISVIFGISSFFKDASGEYFPRNASIVVSSSGHILSSYFKIHPFSLASEDSHVLAGSAPCCFTLLEYKCSLSICYDLRFPELFSSLSDDTYLSINIASWPQPRIDHWYTLLKARAIENQFFMIGVNRSGIDSSNLSYPFSSTIFSPWGNRLSPYFASFDNILTVYNLDFSIVDESRSVLTSVEDRRPSLYTSFLRQFSQ